MDEIHFTFFVEATLKESVYIYSRNPTPEFNSVKSPNFPVRDPSSNSTELAHHLIGNLTADLSEYVIRYVVTTLTI